ncbi:hypothetical protein [Streptomyces boncukensis]|uniref:Uncharacterized protein n=1 Tax=Streptomyces boncukensis TaxID=2711219 RepID=A0A6G4WYP2_9ACTN|nr:hypothetical protein [Streptomyces boncukensis]NGO70123.1 hypothetical protein [Streptomyces boncukensis]
MTLTTQYALDVHRMRAQGLPEPPAPGTHEAKLLRAWWVARREARRQWRADRARTASSAAPRSLRRSTGRA